MKIYLAIPYTGFEKESFAIANKVTARLMSEGHVVFSPISHYHIIATTYNLPKDWNYWKQLDESFIEWCDEIRIVVMNNNGIDRISKSSGVQGEIKIGKKLRKILYYENEGD